MFRILREGGLRASGRRARQVGAAADHHAAAERNGWPHNLQSLSVDGRVLSQQKMEHTIPFLMSLDETLDIGLDTRTPVDESYALPFRFTGTIDKVVYNLRPEQLSAAERDEFERVVAAARDTPATPR